MRAPEAAWLRALLPPPPPSGTGVMSEPLRPRARPPLLGGRDSEPPPPRLPLDGRRATARRWPPELLRLQICYQ